jgi:hypothetical protein
MEDNNMKKAYIIPVAEVVEIKANQLLMTSNMDVLDGEITTSGGILSRECDFDDEEDY